MHKIEHRYFISPEGTVYKVPKSGEEGLDILGARAINGTPACRIINIYELEELEGEQLESAILLYA